MSWSCSLFSKDPGAFHVRQIVGACWMPLYPLFDTFTPESYASQVVQHGVQCGYARSARNFLDM